ncbi:MAG: DNA alkylation repair protein [Planctomycetaceae bacterium]
MIHIAQTLKQYLPEDYPSAVSLLVTTIEQLPQDKHSGFLGMYFPEFVALYGLDDWKTSLPALARFTPFASSEFAVRPFILADPKRMMNQMKKWAKDRNHHVRRLASEGCRPRLPWAVSLPLFKEDPKPVLELLELLKSDPEKYVQNSVANNLNDISKDHPEVAIRIAKNWQGTSNATDWILKHGCRTLLKQSHPQALKLFGFGRSVEQLQKFEIQTTRLKLGSELKFSVLFHVKQKCTLRVEYLIDYLKKNGTHSSKVFQWTEREFSKGEHTLIGKQLFAPMTTRKHYPGKHRIRVRINGQEFEPAEFELQI